MTDNSITGMIVRRSFIHNELEELGASFETIDDYEVAAHITAAQAPLSLCDFSPLPRSGIKGSGSLAILKKIGISIDEKYFHATRTEQDECIACLYQDEFLILSNPDSPTRKWNINELKEEEEKVYQIPFQDSFFWFCLQGDETPVVFEKLCTVDLRWDKFPINSVKQTIIRSIPIIVISWKIRSERCIYLLGPSSSSHFFWKLLTDLVKKDNGIICGLRDLPK